MQKPFRPLWNASRHSAKLGKAKFIQASDGSHSCLVTVRVRVYAA